jgi:ubiquinone/menaquinone biosynthesis C-methylase UbiE
MPAGNRDEVQRSFAAQAAAFEDPTRGFGDDDVVEWLVSNTPVNPGDVVLEVAAGTAIFGRALAPRVACVVAVDLTRQMLAEGSRAAASSGLSNVVFQEGDATVLPFLDESFDRVVSRLAFHHFEDHSQPLGEMLRVCRPDGTITVVDMVVPDPNTQEVFNELERLRDPAHTRALTRAELRASIELAGGIIVHEATWRRTLDGERWLDQTATPPPNAEQIRAAWLQELDRGSATGMQPHVRDGRVEFVHHWDLVVARRTNTGARP